jgi:hypothetical protein
VELSRESRWEGFLSFSREYTDCKVAIGRVVIDPEQPSLFAVERTFACTNRETGVRGVDEDWALGEVEVEAVGQEERAYELLDLAPAHGDQSADMIMHERDEAAAEEEEEEKEVVEEEEEEEEEEEAERLLRLRYCRVYFDVDRSCQERSKSTGARYGWDLPSVVNI